MGGGFDFRPSCGAWKRKKKKCHKAHVHAKCHNTSRLRRILEWRIMGRAAPVQVEEWMCGEAECWEASCWESAAAALALGFCSGEMTEPVSG